MAEENGNGRLLARVDERVEAMRNDFTDFRSEVRKALDEHSKSHDDIERDLATAKVEIARLDERISTWNKLHAGFTTLGSLLAAAFGRQ